jgi:hypothetical protein
VVSQDGPEGKGGKARHGARKADSLSASSERSGFVASFENTVLIGRPIEDVFALLSDFENVPKWNSAIVDTRKLSDGPVGVGAVYQQVRSVPSRSEERFEVTAFNPPHHLEIRGQLGPFPAGGCCADRDLPADRPAWGGLQQAAGLPTALEGGAPYSWPGWWPTGG